MNAPLSIYQSPAERLASTVKKAEVTPAEAAASASHPAAGPSDDEVRTSIRQVTSAIVHYVSENNPAPCNIHQSQSQDPSVSHSTDKTIGSGSPVMENVSRSPSPRRQRCLWVESSFVGPNFDLPLQSQSSLQHHPTTFRNERSAPDMVNPRPGELMLA